MEAKGKEAAPTCDLTGVLDGAENPGCKYGTYARRARFSVNAEVLEELFEELSFFLRPFDCHGPGMNDKPQEFRGMVTGGLPFFWIENWRSSVVF